MTVLREIYDSEINFTVSAIGDGIDVVLGDEWNGIKAKKNSLETWEEVERWFIDKTLEHFPNSQFAKAYRSMQSGEEG